MPSRRTPAPDIAACILLLCAATLLFAIMRSLYLSPSLAEGLGKAAAYAAVLAVCAYAARALFQRQSGALPLSVLLFACLLGAGALGLQVPDTAQVPAGVLGVFGLLLVAGGHRELTAPGTTP